jgi:hypothetical protein
VIVVVLLLMVSLLSSWLRSLRTTPLRRSMNGDDYREASGVKPGQGSAPLGVETELFGGAVMSAAAGGSICLPPKNCFSPLAGLEAVSGGGPCPAEPTRDPVQSRRAHRQVVELRIWRNGTLCSCSARLATRERRSVKHGGGGTNGHRGGISGPASAPYGCLSTCHDRRPWLASGFRSSPRHCNLLPSPGA